MQIRRYQPTDLERMIAITLEGFDGTAIEQLVETRHGLLHGHDWRFRKARQIREDCEISPTGVFVAEEVGEVVGYITTRVDYEIGKGRIPNLAVDTRAQGKGIGRALIQHALNYFRAEGMSYAMIETMDNNAIGQHLYPACGFKESGKQIHYSLRLSTT